MTRKPWPADAWMIVCSEPATANRRNMESVEPAWCRACGRGLVVDGRTLRQADADPRRAGRPVEFFCIECAVAHDPPDLLIDHREGKGGRETWLN